MYFNNIEKEILKQLSEIYTQEDWEFIKKTNVTTREIILFKYSASCSISYFVESSFNKWFNSLPDEINLFVIKINVVKSRHLSQMIAKELNIHHESPQAIWIDKNNHVKWNASHQGISESDLNEHL